MNELAALFATLRESADKQAADALERLVRDGSDRALNRINALDFAAKTGLSEESVIPAFLHAARLGLFELSWNVLCPSCGGVLDANANLKSMRRDGYSCAFCAVGYVPTLDETVEVTFTVSPRVRKIPAHDPSTLPIWEYFRQIYLGSGVDLPEDFHEQLLQEICLESVELPPGDRAILSLQVPERFVIIFEPVTQSSQFLDVQGQPTRERQNLSLVFDKAMPSMGSADIRPGPLRVVLDNRADVRVLPAVFVAGDQLNSLLGKRKPFLTAKRLFTNQTFRDIYRADMLDVDQRLKITSLTFLFTDLKDSTQLYDRVGDLVAFDLVRAHFQMLTDIVASEAGAVVKTIGDAVMATFPTPDRAIAAAVRMRDAVRNIRDDHKRGDLLLKIGIHEGPCLAVMLNDRQDYFGQTVNIAARVQGLAASRSIYASRSVVEYPQARTLLETSGLKPEPGRYSLSGIADEIAVYEIP
jgi:class 3 adenylate cyclase